MREVIDGSPFVLEDGRLLNVSCSIGFACMPFEPGRPASYSWQQVVNLADLALYAGKRCGRNAWVGLRAGEGGKLQASSNKPADEMAEALAAASEMVAQAS